jgi:hypothetical protein
MRPLDGTKVITLEHAIAAPFRTRQLADLGARVIKVEPPRRRRFRARLRQVDAVHRGYASSDADIAWARRVPAVVDASHGAAVAVDGKMVDLPVILKARRIAEAGTPTR